MAEVTYAFYTTQYGGNASEIEYMRTRLHACALLVQYTNGRAEMPQLPEHEHKIKLAICALCDTLLKNEAGGGIASESNDGVSVSYIAGLGKAKTEDGRLYDTALRFLGTTGLMYRGEE